MIGITYRSPVEKTFNPVKVITYGAEQTYAGATLIFDALFKLITGDFSIDDLAGPVGIYSLVGTIVQIPDIKERILQILNLAGLLSISLAFFNVLPIPALDGGRLFFILIEAVTRRKVPSRIEGYIHTVGMAALLTLLLLITFQDVTRIFSHVLTPGQ